MRQPIPSRRGVAEGRGVSHYPVNKNEGRGVSHYLVNKNKAAGVCRTIR